jgi:hypothetical protein
MASFAECLSIFCSSLLGCAAAGLLSRHRPLWQHHPPGGDPVRQPLLWRRRQPRRPQRQPGLPPLPARQQQEGLQRTVWHLPQRGRQAYALVASQQQLVFATEWRFKVFQRRVNLNLLLMKKPVGGKRSAFLISHRAIL